MYPHPLIDPATVQKILFLDFDGVINSNRTCFAFGKYPHKLPEDAAFFDHVALTMIRRLCERGNIEIVVSSTWRLDHSVEIMKSSLRLPIISATPEGDGKESCQRGVLINEWLQANPVSEGKTRTYAILDDLEESEFLPDQRSNFVRVDSWDGFSYLNLRTLASKFGIRM